ncbi:hypothetical protein Tco_0538643 [Tanacetum coccineum]
MYHVTFNEANEVITQTSTEGDEINFNEIRSFLDDDFLVPRRNPSQCTRNDDYLPYVTTFDPLSTNNIIIPNTVIPITLNINSTNESPEFSIADDHLVHNELDGFEPAKNHNDTSETQNITSDDNQISDVKPSPTIISPSAEINHDTPAPQDRWSRDKHILLVNILGLWYPKGSGFDLKAYSDSNYAGCNLDRRSTSRGCQIFRGKLVCWSAKKQISVSMSSVEADENIDSLPPKETMRAGLETLGLVDEKNPNLSSIDLVNSSPLRIRYFSPIWRVLMLHIVKCLGGKGYKNYKLTTFKPYHILDASFKTSKASEVALISHMLKVVNISIEHEQPLILSSEKVNANNINDKSLYGTAVQSVEQPKAPTGRKPKKKKILSSSKPKNSHYVRRSKTKETVLILIMLRNQWPPLTPLRIDEADSDLELMPDDEIMSISRDDNEEANSDQELSTTDDLIAKAVWEKKNIPRVKILNIQALKTDFLTAQVHNVSKNLPTQLTNKFDSSDSTIPRIALTNAVRETLPRFYRIIRNYIKDEIPKVLRTSILKPMYKEFNALNKLETQRFAVQEKKLQKSIRKTIGKLSTKVPTPAQGKPQATDTLVSQTSTALVVHSTIEEPPTIRLKVVMEIPSIPTPTPLKSIKPIIIDNIPFEQFIANMFNSSSSEYSPTPPRMIDKGKGVAQTSDDDMIKQVMPFMKEGRSAPSLVNLQHFRAVGDFPMNLEEEKLQMHEAKRLANIKTKRKKSEKKLKTLTLAQLRAQEEELVEIEMMGFSEWLELHALASKKQNNTNDQLLKNLKAKFQWVATTARKLSIPPLP